jgi:pyrimidine deaminase RibD-like protein
MRRAVDEAKLSRPDFPQQVGVVLAKTGQTLGAAHRAKLAPGDHAEFCLLKELAGADLSGAEVFTTLDPCTRRGEGKVPCAQREPRAQVPAS